MSWWGIIVFIGIGAFVGIFIKSLHKAKGVILQKDFVNLGDLAGLSLEEIESKVGPSKSMTSCTVAGTNKPGSLHTWVEYPYSITLLFDENNNCIGINQETTI